MNKYDKGASLSLSLSLSLSHTHTHTLRAQKERESNRDSLGDDAVEARPLVRERLAPRGADALLPGAQRAEVLDGLGHGLAVESHDDAPRGLAADVDIEEDLVKWLKLVF